MDDPPLRILTIKRPWSWCVADGVKTTENRTGTGWGYRGLVAIHHGKGWSKRGEDDERVGAWTERVRQRADKTFGTDPLIERADRLVKATGQITTVVTLVDAHRAAGCCQPWGEDSYTDNTGRLRTDIVHLTLANPVQLPIPVGWRGSLGLRHPDPDTYTQIMNQYKQVTQ